MSCIPTTTATCGTATASAGVPAVVLLPALVFGAALVIFVVASLRGRDDSAIRLVAGLAMPIAVVLQIVALVVYAVATSIVSGLHVFDHLE